MPGRDLIGGALVAFAALLFGGVVVIGKTDAVQALPVPALLSIRFAVAALALATFLVATRRAFRPASGEGWRLLLLGALGYGVESAFFFLALERGTAATVTLLFYTYPVLVTLLTAALGLGLPGMLVLLSLVGAVAGTALVVTSSGGLDISGLGIVFSLASALTFSGYLLVADRLIPRTPPLTSALWVSLAASAGLATASVVTGTATFPTTTAGLSVAAMGVLTAGAFALLFVGLRRVGAVRTSVIASLEPVAASFLALAFLGEPLRAGVLAGGLLILGGAIAATLARPVPKPERAVP